MSIYNFSSDTTSGREIPGHDGRMLYTTVESSGDSVKEVIANAHVGREDWHGNDRGHVWLSEVNDELYAIVEQEIVELCAGAGVDA